MSELIAEALLALFFICNALYGWSKAKNEAKRQQHFPVVDSQAMHYI